MERTETAWAGPELDTIQPRRCGCVPQLSLVYEDKARGGIPGESWEDPGGGGESPPGRGWARRIPLLGPFWCVRGSATTTIRRRDNAVYRSNSFKFERRGPEEALDTGAPVLSPVQQVVNTKRTLPCVRKEPGDYREVSQAQPRPPARTRNKQKELLVNLNYSDPQDAESESLVWGTVNQAYEGEDVSLKDQVVPGQLLQQGLGYRLKLGQEIYYCKPYQPFHTQLRYNFSDLLESGVDSEYEEMASGKCNNNNKRLEGPGQAAPCTQCVTVINVRSSPGHTLQQKLLPHPIGQGGLNEPPYENLAFHKVTISVPDVGDSLHPQHHLLAEKPRVLLRKPPLKKSRVPLKYQGIKRVKSKSKTQKHEYGGIGRECGYSQKEVWNWLYLEEEGRVQEEEGPVSPGENKGISVQFSPSEFLQATSRLAHLNLEGFERFVGSTIDRALAGARTKSSDPLSSPLDCSAEERVEGEEKVGETEEQPLYLTTTGRDTDMYVSQEQERIGCGDCKSKVRPVCESCLRSGESSCSSALSSLESIKSSQGSGGGAARSRESDSSARGSYYSSDTPTGEEGRHEYMRMIPAAAQSYVRLAGGGQKIYRGRIRASLPLGTGHKPYQTLEVTQQQERPVSRLAGNSLRDSLCLVDPAIQLHQQEWYHGNVSRLEAEAALRLHCPGSYLVRNCESARKDYSLSLKSSLGYMHMRIQMTPSGHYILGQFSRPFASIADMVNYYTVNRLPIKGAEHVSLKTPLCEQLL